jgi:hypothetical protein
LKSAEKELTVAIVETSKYVQATPTLDTKSDSAAAVGVISDAFSRLGNEAAKDAATRVKADLDANAGAKPEVKTMIGGLLRGRGFGG